MRRTKNKNRWLPIIIGTCSLCLSVSFGQVARESDEPATLQMSAASPTPASNIAETHRSFSSSNLNRRARLTYRALWGIDDLQVSEVSSGALLRFSYRVLDVGKARALHDERSKPYLIDEKTGAVLQVPNLPKVGELRPKITPENGKVYWMVFSNKGFVKPGSRVDVVIGSFRATGLRVR